MPIEDHIPPPFVGNSLTIRLNDEEARQFTALCEAFNTTKSRLMKALIAQEYLNLKTSQRKKK
jgi:predicted transcriptional regulator